MAKADGNIQCVKCGKLYSDNFKKCVFCCPHNELILDEEWEGRWILCVKCIECGKDYDFKRDWLIKNFKLVRK